MSDEKVIAAFAEARRTQRRLDDLPEATPPDMDRAFRLQGEITRELGWPQIGWKIGCTSERAQKALNAPGPFPGTMFRHRVFKSGDEVPTIAANHRVVEAEVAFTMGQTLAPRGQAYTADEVLDAVASVHAAIEIVNPRTPKGFADPVPWFVVDGGLNDSIILGEARKPLDRLTYVTLKAGINWNGRDMAGGHGANALGGGDIALAWLANYLCERGVTLKEGDIVTTGVITEFFSARVGDRVEARFEGLGTVKVSF